MTMNDSGRNSGSLSIPPTNPELREREKLTLHGDRVTVTFTMEDGSTYDMEVQTGWEVGLTKRKLREKLKLSANEVLELEYNGKRQLDPMSLSDAWGPKPQHYNFDVKRKSAA